MRVVLITWHYLESKRRAGFHWLADAYWRSGCEVVFVTVSLSWLSLFSGDPRFAYPVIREAGRMKWLHERLASYVWFTSWHPANLRWGVLNRLSSSAFRAYGDLPLGEVEPHLRDASLIIFDATLGLFLFDRLKRMNPQARYVYRVSDDLRFLRNHPLLLSVEDQCIPRFDQISVPSEYIYRRFAHLPTAALHYHGLNKAVFDEESLTPYAEGSINAVFVGVSHFDVDFIEQASRLCPEWRFHIIGPIRGLPERENVISYGEMPFAQTVPYIKHADVGLQTRAYSPGAESLTDSLKVMQYTYCRLPIVAPDFLWTTRNNSFCYKPGDGESMRLALARALEFDRSQVVTSSILSWDELAQEIAGEKTLPG